MNRPLEGIVVLEFSQYLAGPAAGLRLADLGARVIKVERPGAGDGGRRIVTKDLFVEDDSLAFHTINRNKESVAADLKDPQDLALVKNLIAAADVMIHNFRPGVMERLGLDYDTVRTLNASIVYGEVTGYGDTGPWAGRPGQDLLVQCVSGLCHLTGNRGDPPVPMGLAVADMMCGNHLTQGLLAALTSRGTTGRGAKIQVSLLESMIDFQFEVLTTYLNDGNRAPERAEKGNAHAYLAAPYGVYPTKDGYLALAMNSLERLFDLADVDERHRVLGDDPFGNRETIMEVLRGVLLRKTAAEWRDLLEKHGLWCSEVFDYRGMSDHEGYRVLQMEQDVYTSTGKTVRTTRCPIRIDGERLFSDRAAPRLGEDTGRVVEELSGRTPRIEGGSVDHGAVEGRLSTRGEHARSRPLDGLVVVDLSQFLAGPSAGLRLADLGARVIKVERPGTGDICRRLYVSDVEMNGGSSVFHAINRNKESFAADLKRAEERAHVVELLRRADVMIHNFRPGVIERLGLDYETVHRINPSIVYGEISGYGKEGPWREKPGQDLLLQALSGLSWLSGSAEDGPVPFGLAVADMLAGAHVVQGVLSCLARRNRTGRGGRVEISMLESIVDFQFEALTVFRRDGGALPERSGLSNAHPYLGAPYGVYATADGYIALAMAPVATLGELLECPPLAAYTDPGEWFARRDEIKRFLAGHLKHGTTERWLSVLEPNDIWCSEVLDWDHLMDHEGFKVLGAVQSVVMSDGYSYLTTRCPIRVNGEILTARRGSPQLGEHTAAIKREFNLEQTV